MILKFNIYRMKKLTFSLLPYRQARSTLLNIPQIHRAHGVS